MEIAILRLRSNNFTKLILIMVLLLGVFALAEPALAQTSHVVQPGDTLYSISRRYGVSIDSIMQANNIASARLIYAGQTLTIPTGTAGTPPEEPSTTPSETPSQPARTHVVQFGQTLGTIARSYGLSITAVAQANGIVNTNLIYVGQVLTIPGSGETATATPTPTQAPSTPEPSTSTIHIVSFGDTLSRISIQYGVTIQAIMSANGLANANFIYVGQALTIPGASGGTTTPTAPTTPTTPSPGGNTTMFGAQTQSFANLDRMQDTGMTWVKFQHKWAEGDTPGVVSGPIARAHEAGFKILLSIPGQNTYPSSINFDGYVEFLQGVAGLSDPPDAIEIWNEMNIDFEWPAGQISPTTYVNSMLAPAYNAIKGTNGNILVISGAPAPTGFDNNTNAWADDRYMRGLAAAGGTNFMDCVGVHFNAGATSPNTSSGHPGGTHYSWYYTPMVTTYYNATGGAKPLCFTEIGYLTGDGFNSLPQNFGWASGTSLDEHAQWLAEAAQLSKNDSRVMMFIVFNFDFTFYDENGDPQAGYGMVRPGDSCPACDRMKPIITGN
ncbi:MAG: LysM peptidoglycan-binding domain-containing protein [Chloroflexota bacterium]